MPLAAGKFDRRITIQVRQDTRDNAGDTIPDWDALPTFKLWARKQDQRGFETAGSQQIVRTADTVFEVRQGTKSKTIHPESHRIVFLGKIFEIISIQEGTDRLDTFQILTSSRPDGVGARGQGQTDNA
jgi:SPP1 family predicted phage head-tail adaptor